MLGSESVRKAKEDIGKSFLSYPLWMALGWQDIKQRYRRSALGPFWITLSLGVTVAMMGVLYSKLFHQEIRTYLPYLATGMVVWTMISSFINESATVFIQSEGIIKQIPMPFGIHILRMLWRNVIIFCHNMVVVFVVMLLFKTDPGWKILLFPLAIGLLVLNGYWVAILLGILGTRFRDIVQVVNSVVQILFFLTPVMWMASSIHHQVWILECNPLFHVFNIVRNGLMGGEVPLRSWGVVVLMTLVGWGVAFRMLVRYRARIAYWL
ncbi:ABC transporter permease [Leptospirillum ferriphilum]|uniref:ABC transporter permease n=1 Tax=Leptospirillum ferriphilum TaxID=178606 RepID=UPI002117D485|nr:ABC transporter permease [Leptospirillum ferriphilum]